SSPPTGRPSTWPNRSLRSRASSSVQLIGARSFRLIGFIRTRADAHGLYVSRNTKDLYMTNRAGRAITVISFATRRIRRLERRRHTRHGQHQPGRHDPVGIEPLHRLGAGDLHPNRPADRINPSRSLSPRSVRLASTRLLLHRPHRV